MTPDRLQLRAAGALGLLVVALLGLLVRLAGVQILAHDEWEARADRQHLTGRRTLTAERGTVADRHGRPLARTELLPSVAVDPMVLRARHEAQTLGTLVREELGTDLARVLEGVSPQSQFAWVRRKIADRGAVERLQRRADAEGLKSLVVQHESVRTYPGGEMASHLVGFAFEDPRRGLSGAEGAERLGESLLRGVPGASASQRDAYGRRIVLADAEVVAPRDGGEMRLTIDSVIQAYAEDAAEQVFTEHAPQSAVAAVLDVRTGELLAVAVRPTYDPNDRNVPVANRRNRFFADTFEPGSSFKPIAMGMALDVGAVSPNEHLDTRPGTIRVGRRTIREDKHKNLGVLTPGGVLAQSSNVGMAKIALRLGIPRMHAGVRLFGFGAATGIGWIGESRGIVTPLERWTESYTLCSVSFGQEIAVTPAQLLAAYGGLANDGLMHPLRLVLDAPRRAPVRVLRPESAQRLALMLEEVYASGTAARIDRGGYRLAGKTGTAEQKDRRGGIEYVGSFACFGPVEAPRLAVLVVCDRPSGKPYGSLVAAPYATRLLRDGLRYLGVAPRVAVDANHALEVHPR